MILKMFSPKHLAKNLAKNLAFFSSVSFCKKNLDHNIGFCDKRQFLRPKLVKIGENFYHNIDPRFKLVLDQLLPKMILPKF
jgi:hypothetical protein